MAWFGVLSVVSLLFTACTSVPAPSTSAGGQTVGAPSGSLRRKPTPGFSLGDEIVVRAIALVGTPYQFGGSGPKTFDCSGLVQYLHHELGVGVPRTALEQYHAAARVRLKRVKPGDLLFFRTQGNAVSHVAIYAGSGRFVHAPQTGGVIELRGLDDAYFRQRLVGAGRLLP